MYRNKPSKQLKRLALPLLTLSFLLSQTLTSSAQKPSPNILFFLIDDLNYKTLGYAGDPIVKTPNIDALAKSGVNFSNTFATTSICAASRASILTGKYERAHGYTFHTPPLRKQYLSESYPAILNKHGYKTGFIGKYGVSNPKQIHPAKLFSFYHPLSRTPYWKKQKAGPAKHITSITVEQATKFIHQTKPTEPFCLSISFNAVHAEDRDKKDHFPWPSSSNGLYEKTTFPPPELNDPSIFSNLPDFLKKSENRRRFHWRWDTQKKFQKNKLGYYRMISGVDTAIGKIISVLKQQNLEENTVVIVMSDNGFYMGNRGLAGKWSHFDESLRIPLIINDPRAKNNLSKRSEMALNIDIPSTILDLAGCPIPEGYQGKSLVPLISPNPAPPWRTDFLCEHLMVHPHIPIWEGVRSTRFSYAKYTQQKPAFEFLHDLENDPDQLINLAAEKAYKPVLTRMRNRCSTLIEKNSIKK